MRVGVGDLLTINGVKYITLEKLTYENKYYIFSNKVINDDVTDEYYIFEIISDGAKMIVEEDLKNILIPKFQNLLQNRLKNLLNN